MLSTENPPPDLPCPCDISQLKSSSSDERASENINKNQVDLLKSGLDDNNPLPKFSIRDYVFDTRGKDIENNWPFSQKNLQLCMKYGVKDVLPPFQSPDSVRNPSTVKCAIENINYSDVKLCELSDHNVGQKLAVDFENINSSGSQEDKEFPSTTTSQSCSDINSAHQSKDPYLEPEAEYLPRSPKEKSEISVQPSKKVESNIQNPVKKCRLIVKLNTIAEPTSNDALALNTCVVSETMASKVCPVCKTFSSSSNTTLNAHIDQCLSGESTINWTTNSKVIKHRIKPRKTRLMVDIYETALQCTLEDLDRRNGTNWASSLGFPAQDSEACDEEKNNKTYSSVNIVEDVNEEGGVYIDSSGTKLRILSKLSDQPSNSNASCDCGPRNLVKRDKGNKFVSIKKKKYLVHKHKLQKNSHYGQGSSQSSPTRLLRCRQRSCYPEPQVNNGQPKKFPPEGYKEDIIQPPKVYDQMKTDDLGMIKQWVGSKRTGLKKKINLERENQHPHKMMKNLRVKSGVSSSVDTLVKRNIPSNFPISSDENPLLPCENQKRKENFFNYNSHIEQPSERRRPGVSLLKSQDCLDKKNHLVLTKFNVKRSREDSPSVHEPHIDPPNGTENHVSSRGNKKMRINTSPAINNSFISTGMPHHHTFSSEGKKLSSLRKASLDHAISSGTKKFSSLRKQLLSVRHASAPESKKNLGRNHLEFKNPRLHYTSGSDEEAVVSRSTAYRQDNLVETLGENAAQMEKASGRPFINRTGVLKVKKERAGFVKTGKGDMTLKGSETAPESDIHGVRKNIDSFIGGSVPVDTTHVLEDDEVQDELFNEPTYKMADGEAFIAFSKSLDSAFPGLVGPSNIECVPQHYSKAYEGDGPDELALGGEPDPFCADEVGKDLVTSNSHVVAETDADEAQRNYFIDVDPIPIPGPPGSFLPSPGRMESEELQGNSSLTTCRLQSSEDEHEVVDMDSSDSPISAISAVSNSVAARSDSVSVLTLSVQSPVRHGTQDRIDAVSECSTPSQQAPSAERELNIRESRAKLTSPEVSTREFRNIQPCCCSRKDGALQSGSSRGIMTSLSVLAQGKQTADDSKIKIHGFNLRSETLPENAANSPIGCAALVSHNSEAKDPASGDSEPSTPSTSNPVLRLMGKNLMVVNKAENLSPQSRSTQSGVVIEHRGMRLCGETGLSTGSNQNEPHSFHHSSSPCPSIFENMQTSKPVQHFDFNSSDGFKIPANFRPEQLSAHPSTVMLPRKSFGGSFTSSLKCHEYAGGCNSIPDQLGYKIRLDTQTTYDIEKFQTPLPQLKTADSSGGKHKEIIVIDDSPESEAGLAIQATHSRVSTLALRHNSRLVNPFHNYQTRGYPLYTGYPMAQNGNTKVPPLSKGMNANLSKWNCTPDDSSVLHPNSLTAALPPTVHLRSSLYYSPGFS